MEAEIRLVKAVKKQDDRAKKDQVVLANKLTKRSMIGLTLQKVAKKPLKGCEKANLIHK
jgi:hypothetical protein